MNGIAVRVLGALELRVEGLLAPIERVQVRRMLALLATSPGATLSVDQVIEELWPGDLPKSPRATVRVIASRLRGALGTHADALRSNGHAYVFDIGDDAIDARTFEALITAGPASRSEPARQELARLETALALWRGEPFGGAVGPPLLDRTAAYLAELRLSGSVRRAELLTHLGDAPRAVALLTPLLAADELDERLHAAYAIALARAGRRGEALDAIDRAERRIRAEHGLTTGELIAAAERVVEAHDGARPPTVVVPTVPLFGRDGELQGAVDWLTAESESPSILVVTGEPGSGKSALALAIAAQLGWESILAQCDPDLVDIESLTKLLDVDTATASGDVRSRAIRVVDELIASLNERAGGGPLLLVIEDLHSAGEVELRFLLRLARGASPGSVRVVATSRSAAAVEGSHSDLLAKLDGHGRVQRIELGGLDRDASRQLFALRRGSTPNAAELSTLLELTDGNPYLIGSVAEARLDLLALRVDGLGPLLRDVTDARLTRMRSSDADLLRAAAALGRTIDVEVIASVVERPGREVAAAIDRANRAQIVVEDEHGVRFDHELTRIGLAVETGPAEAALLHAAATDACRVLGRDPTIIARHILGAASLRADRRAVVDLLAGADRSFERGRFDDAVRFLTAVGELEIDPERRLDIDRQRAWAMECAGDRAGATVLYGEIFSTARQLDLPTILARAALGGVAFGGVVGGDPGRLDRILEALDHPPADERLHLDLAAAAVSELDGADLVIPADLLELVERLAEDDDARAVRMMIDLRVLRRMPVSERLLVDVEEFVRAARRGGSPWLGLEAEEMLVRARLTRGDLHGAEAAHADLERTVRSNSWPRYVWSVAMLTAVFADLRGRPEEAADLARRAMRIGREHGVADADNGYSMFVLSVAHRDGGLGELEPWIRAAVDGPSAVPAWHAVLAAALAERGDSRGATEALERFWAATGENVPAFTHIGLALAAHAGRLLGDAATTRACIERLLPWSGNLLIVGAGAASFGPADLVLAGAMEAVGDRRAAHHRHVGEALLDATLVHTVSG